MRRPLQTFAPAVIPGLVFAAQSAVGLETTVAWGGLGGLLTGLFLIQPLSRGAARL